MFRTNSLIPTEAVRLAALAMLAEQPRRYGDLALEIRHFTGRIVGPSLDLMGTSLELLRFEGLIEAVDGEGMADNAVLRLTEAGCEALRALLQARLAGLTGEVNRLALALKLRFLHLLPPAEMREQFERIAEWCAGEMARLEDLRQHHHGASPFFAGWLDRDIAQLRERLEWLKESIATLPENVPAEGGPG
jgi:DNA-binding PadR family transcriptional regulator